MEMIQYVPVVAIYTTFPHLDRKPHDYAAFWDQSKCEAAARYFETRQPEKYDRYVAVCAPRKAKVDPFL